MPSREPSTTCPSPLHFTGSLTCRLGRGQKTNLLPDPGYNVAFLTNICLDQDGGCCPDFKKNHPPGHSPSKNPKCQNPIKKMSSPKSPAAMFKISCLEDINTKKRLILLCSESEFSGVQCATLEVA